MIEDECCITHLPLRINADECSCCGASYNRFDKEEHPPQIISIFCQPCPYCFMPRPSTKNSENDSNDVVTLMMVDSEPELTESSLLAIDTPS